MFNVRRTMSALVVTLGVFVMANAIFLSSASSDEIPMAEHLADCHEIGEFNIETCHPDTGCTAEMGNECVPTVVAPSGEQCYACRPKDPTDCLHYNYYESCESCAHDELCIPMPTAKAGICYDCRKGLECKHYELADSCAQCKPEQACKPVSVTTGFEGKGEPFTCYECLDKEKCEDYELYVDCSSCKEGEECYNVIVGTDPYTKTTCFGCRPADEKPKITCEDLQAYEDCKPCKETENCVPAKLWNKDLKCYYCVPKGGCEEAGLITEALCKANCQPPVFECIAAALAPNGEQCFDCVEKKLPGCKLINRMSFAMCAANCPQPGICKPTFIAPNKEDCYDCIKDCANVNMLNGGCLNANCPEGFECEVKMVGGVLCHHCVKSPNKCWEEDALVGPCPADCPQDMTCVDKIVQKQKCHICEPKPKKPLPPPIVDDELQYPPPPPIKETGQRAPGWCTEKGWFDDTSCNGQCPKKLCTVVMLDESTGKPAKGKITRTRGSLRKCYGCIKEITWVIIIIETPRGRYILDGAGGLQEFVPSQVMALAKVNNPDDTLKQLAGMLPGASNSFGTFNTLISMDSLGGLLKQSMEKSGKYADDCFAKDFKQEALPKEVPASAASSGSEEDSPYGEDPGKNLSTGGPMIACGMLGKEKALAVYDAHGKPVDIITPSMLKSNPNAVLEALEKAQSASDELLAKRDDGWQEVADRAQAKIINKKTSELIPEPEEDDKKAKKKKDKEPAAAIVPNDPLYAAPIEKKKKKLLGILGSSKQPKMFALGSELKMGMRKMGAVTAGSDKEEEIKYQWGLHEIGFTPLSDPNSAWNVVDEEKRNVVIAIIDSGFDFNHPDAPAYVWMNEGEVANNGIDDDNNGYVDDVHGWNFLDNNNDLSDLEGHGTFVAGIIAAKTNNGTGIAGINPGAVIMPVKVANDRGETNSFLIARAIFYAADNGAQVINISLGARVLSDLEQAALNYARAKGIFVAIASGNVNENIGAHGPAANKGAFAVGSIDVEGNRSTISNWGPNNAVLAPGDAVISNLAMGKNKKLKVTEIGQGYNSRSGTSFSTPMAAATASLLLAQNPHLSNEDIEDILHRTADEMYEEGWDGESGAGLLNAAAALRLEVNDRLTVKINETRLNLDEKKKLDSVDVFASVRGQFKEFTVEVGKGKLANRFDKVAGPFTQQASHDWVAHLPVNEYFRGSKEWVIRLKVMDNAGHEHTAQTFFELGK